MEEETQNTEQERIPAGTKGAMIATALLFDGINAAVNLIPFLGQVLSVLVSIIAYMLFAFWFLMRGVGFVNPKRAVSFFGSSTIELIPILNVLPGVTLGVVLTIYMVKLEDTAGIKMPSMKT